MLQQRPHHVQVIAPDELVAPAVAGVGFLLLVGPPVVEEGGYVAGAFLLALFAGGAGLVDPLDDLEGQAGQTSSVRVISVLGIVCPSLSTNASLTTDKVCAII
jgi:hypothetical protein